eukprot:4909242-Pyramimonas_sp.AAC.2
MACYLAALRYENPARGGRPARGCARSETVARTYGYNHEEATTQPITVTIALALTLTLAPIFGHGRLAAVQLIAPLSPQVDPKSQLWRYSPLTRARHGHMASVNSWW